MKSIAVIFGGKSTEHDVSVVTAIASIIKPLELTRQYKVEPVYISKNGTWYWDERLKDISLFSTGKIKEYLHNIRPASISLEDGFILEKSTGITGRKKRQKMDIVFPSMHGTFGEDGSLMGLLRMANVPFVGCDMDSSVLAMDKVLAKILASSEDVPTAKYEFLYRDTFAESPKGVLDSIERSLKYPLFVKPAHLGSSIGISRVTSRQELQNALEVASHYDEKVLVEQEIANLIEVTLPIMGNKELRVALLERPLTKPEDFFDFDTKYLQGRKKGGQEGDRAKGTQGYSEIPARIDKDLYEKAKLIGLKMYRILGCRGIARIDMLIDSKIKEVYFNEVNPLPGGLYSHNWQAAGVSSVELVKELIRLAEDRWQSQQRLATVFDTNYLRRF